MKLAVIGAGSWGMNLVRVFHDLLPQDAFQVVDKDIVNRDQVSSIYPYVKVTSDLDEVLKDPSVDSIVIATPADSHYEIARAALLSGKNVLVEKPIALSTDEAEILKQFAISKSKALMVDHIMVYNPAVRRLKKIVEDGDLGSILYLTSTRSNFGIFRNSDDVLWDLGPHDISMLIYLMGCNPTSVRAFGQKIVRNNLDVVSASLYFPEKTVAKVELNLLSPKRLRLLTLVGTKKLALFDDSEESLRIYNKRAILDKESGGIVINDQGYIVEDISKQEPLRVMAERFIDYVNNGTKPVSDSSHALDVIRIIDALDQSIADEGSRINLN